MFVFVRVHVAVAVLEPGALAHAPLCGLLWGASFDTPGEVGPIFHPNLVDIHLRLLKLVDL